MSGSFASVSVHLGDDVRIHCHSYRDSGPILAVTAGGVHLTVHAAKHKMVGPADVANARALADAVAVYLAECERVYRETHAHSAVDGDTQEPVSDDAGPVDGPTAGGAAA